MTTNPPRVKAGGLPPTQLHRVNTIEQLEPDDGVSVMPIQYAGPEPDDEDGPEEMLAAVIVLTVTCIGLGFFIAGVMT